MKPVIDEAMRNQLKRKLRDIELESAEKGSSKPNNKKKGKLVEKEHGNSVKNEPKKVEGKKQELRTSNKKEFSERTLFVGNVPVNCLHDKVILHGRYIHTYIMLYRVLKRDFYGYFTVLEVLKAVDFDLFRWKIKWRTN